MLTINVAASSLIVSLFLPNGERINAHHAIFKNNFQKRIEEAEIAKLTTSYSM
jgi:hypothetical protein